MYSCKPHANLQIPIKQLVKKMPFAPIGAPLPQLQFTNRLKRWKHGVIWNWGVGTSSEALIPHTYNYVIQMGDTG
jgi:hypothetical protein